MAKAPAMQFYVKDWYTDTGELSLRARGAWSQAICKLHLARKRGRLTKTRAAWGRVFGCSADEADEILHELQTSECADVTFRNSGVTLVSRRQERERKEKEANALRQARHRAKQASNEKVTSPSASAVSASAQQPEEVEEGARPAKITFSFDGQPQGFQNITEADKAAWHRAYPAVDIEGEILRAGQWLLSNPDKRKKNYRRFLTNWFARSQERGGSKDGPTQAGSRQQRQAGGSQDGANGGEEGKYGDGESVTA